MIARLCIGTEAKFSFFSIIYNKYALVKILNLNIIFLQKNFNPKKGEVWAISRP